MDKYGETPLHAAACGEKDCPEVCEILLKHNAKINPVTEDRSQPLHFACTEGHKQTGKLLLSHVTDSNTVNKYGETPLHAAPSGEEDCPEQSEIIMLR